MHPHHELERVHMETIAAFRNVLPPTYFTTDTESYIRYQLDRPILYNGRPANCRGAPMVIYAEPLANLEERLEHPSSGYPDKELVSQTAQLFHAATGIYVSEGDREDMVYPLLERLLGVTLEKSVRVDDDNHLAEFNAVARTDTAQSFGVAHYFTAEEYANIRRASCLPCVFLTIAGPYICVYGAVLVDVFIVQPSTEVLFMGGTPFLDDRIIRVAKIFDGLRPAMLELQEYYRALQPLDVAPSDNDDGPKETPVLVKFCSSYNAEAHELLARAGYAPKLHFCGDLVGSVTMVVMDYTKCEIAHSKFRANEPLPEQVIQAVQSAIEILHRDAWVSGDLRRPNIL
ncbi:hypothetical protein FRB99_003650, partial [Tulasnella sp. 403]